MEKVEVEVEVEVEMEEYEAFEKFGNDKFLYEAFDLVLQIFVD